METCVYCDQEIEDGEMWTTEDGEPCHLDCDLEDEG